MMSSGRPTTTGPGRPGTRRKNRLSDEFVGPLRVVQHHHAFGARIEPGLGVEFLECFFFPVLERDQSDEKDHRRGILPRRVQSDVRVRRARPAGDHGDAGQVGQFSFGFGHVCGPALMSTDDGVDRRVVEAIEDVEEAFPGNGVNPVDAVVFEGADDRVSR